jgi:uncharacterized phage protein (TIGR01671 family)
MREIKFRAWKKDGRQKNGGTMLSHDELTDDYGHVCVTSREDLHVMQYTGLKDKNGKEIYEGDVVRVKGMAHEIYQVVFSRASFVLEEVQGAYYVRISMQDEYQMEVIGNIYENPDLLT